jgi:hypothetical protein
VAPDGSDVITEIKSGGQITAQLGRKVYNDPNNPYGIDLIVYGYAFFSAADTSGTIGDGTDLNAATLSSGFFGHSATISVSQDGTHWYVFSNTPALFPDEAYRWDDTNASWTDEEMNPTKPLNPYIYTNNFGGQSVASGLDQFIGAAGGSGYNLNASGLPWIQYVRVQPGAGTYTVIDAIAAVDPVVVGDALSITPGNLASGITSLVFQKPDDTSQSLIAIDFDSVSDSARISTVSLNDFSSFAPVEGNVSSAYQIMSRPVTGTNAVTFQAGVGLRAGDSYTGNGNDLRVFQWNSTNWTSQQIVPPQLSIQALTNGFAFQFTPVPNCAETLERSVNLLTWTPISTFTATNVQPITLQDTHAPAGKAFYRVQLNP